MSAIPRTPKRGRACQKSNLPKAAGRSARSTPFRHPRAAISGEINREPILGKISWPPAVLRKARLLYRVIMQFVNVKR